MEEQELSPRTETCPGEVVEVYRPRPRETVEVYSRSLPARMLPAPPAGKRHPKRGLWVFSLCVALMLALAAGAYLLSNASGPNYYGPFPGGETAGETEITMPTYPTGKDASLPVVREHGEAMTAQEIYRQVNPSVVTVVVQLEDSAALGTGVIFSEDGYILTNYHVVEGGSDCVVALDTGHSYAAMYVAGDEESDLAVLKVNMTGLPAAAFGDSDFLTVGDKVYAIGNPLGVELRGTLTDGLVSAINRDVRVDNRTMTLIQTNAALNSGNSGGPLINEYGQVVGINTIKMSSAYSSVEGLGFAIPSASIQRLVNDLLTYGETQPEPLLGITVNQTAVQLDGGARGLEVFEVSPGSAADLAGIREGDFIVSAGGEELSSSADLMWVRRQYHVDDQLPMTVWRQGETRDVILSLRQSVGQNK